MVRDFGKHDRKEGPPASCSQHRYIGEGCSPREIKPHFAISFGVVLPALAHLDEKEEMHPRTEYILELKPRLFADREDAGDDPLLGCVRRDDQAGDVRVELLQIAVGDRKPRMVEAGGIEPPSVVGSPWRLRA